MFQISKKLVPMVLSHPTCSVLSHDSIMNSLDKQPIEVILPISIHKVTETTSYYEIWLMFSQWCDGWDTPQLLSNHWSLAGWLKPSFHFSANRDVKMLKNMTLLIPGRCSNVIVLTFNSNLSAWSSNVKKS